MEIGCGSGATINRIAREFKFCKGIDLYDYAEKFEDQREKCNALNSMFQQIDLENETLPERFPRIVSFEVIEHFKSEDTVGKYYELLEPGGLLAITVPNKWWIFETHGAKLPLLPWNRVPFFSWLPRPLHEKWANARIYTKSRISKLLEKHGFVIDQIDYVTAPLDVLKEGRLKKWLQKNIFKGDTTKHPMRSTAIFVLAHKPQ